MAPDGDGRERGMAPGGQDGGGGDDGRPAQVSGTADPPIAVDPPGAPGRTAGPGRAGRPRVLIVEDELIIAWQLTLMVEDLGYEVCGTAADEPEAVRLALEAWPDVVLMDVQLARDGDGIRAAATIRAALRLPVVFCTAYAADPSSRARMAAAGAAGVLSKPVLPAALGAAIAAALRVRRD